MKRNKYQIIIGLVLILLSSCDATIHEYPDVQKASIVIELNADRSAPKLYKQLIYDYEGNFKEILLDSVPALAYVPDENFELRFIVELYNVPLNKAGRQIIPLERRIILTNKDKTEPQDTVHFELPDGNYSILAWADYVPEGSNEDWYFEAPTLTTLTEESVQAMGSNHMKDAAAGNKGFHVDFIKSPTGYTSGVVPVSMKRASGRFRLIANDLKEFQEAEGDVEKLKLKIVYHQYVSCGYNVATQQPNQFVQTRNYVTQPEKKEQTGEDNTLLMAYDYILVSTGKEDHIMVDIHVYEDDDTAINHYEGLKIPLLRNRETIVYGPFLTQKKGTGGVSIDDKFDGEHTVIVRD